MYYEERIIGDFFEINADNLKYKIDNKKNPFSIIIYKINQYKLKSRVKKLRNLNIVLNKNNIIEFVSYICNNYPPAGSYKNIKKSKIGMKDTEVEFVISFDNITAIINTIFENISIIIKVTNEDNSTTRYNLELPELEANSSARDIREVINKVNNKLVEIMCDYIEENLNKYK